MLSRGTGAGARCPSLAASPLCTGQPPAGLPSALGHSGPGFLGGHWQPKPSHRRPHCPPARQPLRPRPGAGEGHSRQRYRDRPGRAAGCRLFGSRIEPCLSLNSEPVSPQGKTTAWPGLQRSSACGSGTWTATHWHRADSRHLGGWNEKRKRWPGAPDRGPVRALNITARARLSASTPPGGQWAGGQPDLGSLVNLPSGP